MLNSLGIGYQRFGELEEAKAAYQECREIFRQLGENRLAATAALNLGTLAQKQGNYGAAIARYREAERLASRDEGGATQACAAANEANLLLIFGAFDASDEKLKAALAMTQELGSTTLEGQVLIFQAELARWRGDPEGARRCLQHARQVLDEAAGQELEDALLLEAELALDEDDIEGATRLLAPLRKISLAPWAADLLRARLALAQHDAKAAQSALERCLKQGVAPERRFEAMTWLYQCQNNLDHPDAPNTKQRAEETLQALRQQVPPQFRQSFDAHPAVSNCRARLDRLPTAPFSSGAMERLLEINRELNQRLPLQQLLERLLEGAIELTGAERGFVLLRQNNRLKLAASRTLEGEAVKRPSAKFSQSIAERALREQRTVVVADAEHDTRFRQQLSVSGLRLRGVLCVPLTASSEVRGALYLDNRFRHDVFNEATVSLCEAFAEQAGIALENARLLGEATQRGEELARAKLELERLNRTLEEQVARQSEALSAMSVRFDHQEEELVRRFNAARIIGRSKPMRELFAKIERVAQADLPVVIGGESGTGKELVARALHRRSLRGDEPFVAVNCGAIPSNLLESELFGTKRGAFTGAVKDRPGVFEVAGEGTLFLDEVGDMEAEMQVKLLRVLQEGRFRRLGDSEERESRCRVISASHKHLPDLVASGSFREDLFYRLHVIALDLPPLRRRRDDIPLITEHLLAKIDEENERKTSVDAAAMRALVDYDWPGNVRELENELARAALLGEGRITRASLSPAIRGEGDALPKEVVVASLRDELARHERHVIEDTLTRHENNVTRAAEALQIHRVVLHRKLKAYGLKTRKPKPKPRPQRGS
ncbi:MAG: sigma 54-interacting transcriptional regulator [Deltaproteobacteria bacterium]|nr:sigma 54-interacting transcriptional regulator [Deltaproteobacteria bacterium]